MPPHSLFNPKITTTIARKKPYRPQLLYTNLNAHPHNPHTIEVHARQTIHRRISKLHTSVDQVAKLNEQYFPQQQKIAREKAKLLSSESNVRESIKQKTIAQAQVIRTLLEMQYFFSDFITGGLFVSQGGQQLKTTSNTEDNPFLYVAETLDRVFANPNILLEVPILEVAHQLTGLEDAYFDRFTCRRWLERINVLVVELLQPLQVLPNIASKSRLRQAWILLRGNPLQRALNLARMGRLFFVVGEHSERVIHLAMKKAWNKWKPLWLQAKKIIHRMRCKRNNRILQICFQHWQHYIITNIWDTLSTTKIDIKIINGMKLIEHLELKSKWLKWKKMDYQLQRMLSMQQNAVLLSKTLSTWLLFVAKLKQVRQDKALQLLMKCGNQSKVSKGNKTQERMADLFSKTVTLQQHFRQWKQWKIKQQRLRNMVVHALKNMVGKYLGLAFVIWKHNSNKNIENVKEISKKKIRIKKISHCHMCNHVSCPPSCRYLLELKKSRRQWRHIKL